MATWKIERCTVNDAAALAHYNLSAFREAPNWMNGWVRQVTLNYLLKNLLSVNHATYLIIG
jgi:hypothetical protein